MEKPESEIAALNEESSTSESEDETNRKLSKEAQEEQAKQKYNHALKTLINGQKEEAVALLEKLLADPCLYPPQDNSQFTPFQQQLLLGCLKILGDLYRDGPSKNLDRAKQMFENAICIDSEDNINLWYRLGKISYETGDLYVAHDAFAYALRLRPSHWGCLENIVTISYVTQDYIGCLHYCAAGLSKDPAFGKGLVFRDMVFNIFPEMKTTACEKIKDGEALNSKVEYQQTLKDKYVDEMKKISVRWQERIKQKQAEVAEAKPKPKIHFDLTVLSLVEVMKHILAAYEAARNTPEFHESIEFTWKVQDAVIEVDDSSSKPATQDSSLPEEESQNGIRRSRSSSDDKDNITMPHESSNQQGQEENGERGMELASENSQPLDSQAQGNEGDGGGKKKNKRDVKWWQIEGKRRSQRVRGHLMPTSPDKAKKESSFADQLKNLIPPALLSDERSSCERECAKQVEKSPWQKKLNLNYFGTKEEEAHAKELLELINNKTLPVILIKAVQFLVSHVTYPWPIGLRDLYVVAYKYHRSHMVSPNALSSDSCKLVTEALTCLAFIEIFVEHYRIELNIGDKDMIEVFNKEVIFFDDCVDLLKSPPKDVLLRMKWLTVRRLLQMAQRSNEEETNHHVCYLLSQMELDLRNEPLTIWTVNESTNLICLESVTEKAAGLAKMKNSQVVTDMFQNEQYEALIGILQSCINFSEIEKRDLSDLYFYTVALFRVKNQECIYQCLNLMNNAIRFQDNSFLSESLVLMEEIWENLKEHFSLADKRLAVGYLIKILVSCERKPPLQETILTAPWCLLHMIMFSLEREEPAFYLEEDTVPNSVLLLQLAHECMSRSDKCCINSGKLLLYTMKAILEVKKMDEYMVYEETRHCMEQAIFCMYSHPNKKSKIKYLKDHNSTGLTLTWSMCPILFQYYCPDEIPEFDSYGSIGGEVETLFQRMLKIMPKELEPEAKRKVIENCIETCKPLPEEDNDEEEHPALPDNIKDIYYLMGDYYFKTKEWPKSVSYYTRDLAVNPKRFDSWAGIALSLGENINTTLNTADEIDFRDLLKKAQSTAYCFNNALKIDPLNMKLRIEFGSFVYAMHAYCSRLMKQQATIIDIDLFNIIEKSQQDFLRSSFKCFEPIAKNALDSNDSCEMMEDELWIHHYMLGKIYEKMLFKDGAEQFLKQYELAGKLLHEQGAPYPSKMNYYSPPELAVEALEIYYRIHASILTIVENSEYSVKTERLLLQFIRRQEEGPFVKCKQSRDGDSNKRGRKAAEETASKKDMNEITALVKEMVDKAEKIAEAKVASNSSSSTSSTSTSGDDDSSSDSSKTQDAPPKQQSMSSFSLSEFKKRLQEQQLREEKLALEAQNNSQQPKVEDLYEGLDLENNRFQPLLKNVKFGSVVALCLKAMEECISRYPYHYKAYFRLAHSYMVFMKDANGAREYLLGSPQLSARKINGLLGERKANNFFNGIWRNPIDDIDRPGSFSYHMNKTMHLLVDVLSRLNDHSLLADIALHLAKVPDNEKKYLSNPDREMFCQQAFNASIASAKRKTQESGVNFHELGLEIFETYQKLQKHNSRLNILPSVLHDLYKLHCRSQNVSDDGIVIEHAMKYFGFHYMTQKASLSRPVPKAAAAPGSDLQRSGGDGAPPRKRGRRAARQTSQEAAIANPTTEFDNALYNSMASMLQARNVLGSSTVTSSTHSILPTMAPSADLFSLANMERMQGIMNPMKSMPKLGELSTNQSTPPPAHEARSGQASSGGSASATHLKLLTSGTVTEDNQSRQLLQQRTLNISPSTPSVASKKSESTIGKASTSASVHSSISNLQPIRHNTSPYKTQTTVVEQPPSFSFKPKDFKSHSQEQGGKKGVPPAAHSNIQTKKACSTAASSSDESDVEVIDLTVKTPDKQPERETIIRMSATPTKDRTGTEPDTKTTSNRTESGVTDSDNKLEASVTQGSSAQTVTAPKRAAMNVGWDLGAGPKEPVMVTIRKPVVPKPPQPQYPLPPKKKRLHLFCDPTTMAPQPPAEEDVEVIEPSLKFGPTTMEFKKV